MSELELQRIERKTNIAVNHLGLERTIELKFRFWFFDIVSMYNTVEFQLYICEWIFFLDIILNFFTIRKEDFIKNDKQVY